jgi:hypothetical protein
MCCILPCVTLIHDLHVLEVLNYLDTCHFLVVPCALRFADMSGQRSRSHLDLTIQI